jgi:hypothetical protein
MELTLYDLLGIPVNADPIAIDTAEALQRP